MVMKGISYPGVVVVRLSQAFILACIHAVASIMYHSDEIISQLPSSAVMKRNISATLQQQVPISYMQITTRILQSKSLLKRRIYIE